MCPQVRYNLDDGFQYFVIRMGRMKVKSGIYQSSSSPTPPPPPQTDDDMDIPSVRVWLELNGYDGTGAVDVGQPTTMSIRAVLPDKIGVRVVNCAALDGIGDASQTLFDDRGCPIDEQVKPFINTMNLIIVNAQ